LGSAQEILLKSELYVGYRGEVGRMTPFLDLVMGGGRSKTEKQEESFPWGRLVMLREHVKFRRPGEVRVVARGRGVQVASQEGWPGWG
jgi:hypothetical protein